MDLTYTVSVVINCQEIGKGMSHDTHGLWPLEIVVPNAYLSFVSKKCLI